MTVDASPDGLAPEAPSDDGEPSTCIHQANSPSTFVTRNDLGTARPPAKSAAERKRQRRLRVRRIA